MADYKIEPGGKLVTFLKNPFAGRLDRSQNRAGAQLSFQSKDETAEFVRAGECHGFTFEGKEYLPQAS
ncbi:MAG: hypothetical protein JO356_21005 [Acidobacteria bacterium]|nr:hypothetical protein [Acidobacteriota bacterium]